MLPRYTFNPTDSSKLIFWTPPRVIEKNKKNTKWRTPCLHFRAIKEHQYWEKRSKETPKLNVKSEKELLEERIAKKLEDDIKRENLRILKLNMKRRNFLMSDPDKIEDDYIKIVKLNNCK